MSKLMKQTVRNTKPSTKPFPVSKNVSIREPVFSRGAEDIVTPLIESLFEIQKQ